MIEAMAVLFGIEDKFDVTSVDRIGPGQVQVIIEMRARRRRARRAGCGRARVRERPLCRIKDLSASGQQVELWWRKRRLARVETLCLRRSFTW